MKNTTFILSLLLLTISSCNNLAIKNPTKLTEDTANLTQPAGVLETEYYKPMLDSFPFEKYSVESLYTGKIAKLEPSYYMDSPKDTREIILKKYNNIHQPNFAGHYIVIDWACGSPCQMNGVVDVITGKTVAVFNTSLGISYQASSCLIIENPPIEKIYKKEWRKTIGEPTIKILKNNQLVPLMVN